MLKGQKKIHQTNGIRKTVEVAILTSNKINFKIKKIIKRYFIMINSSIQQ